MSVALTSIDAEPFLTRADHVLAGVHAIESYFGDADGYVAVTDIDYVYGEHGMMLVFQLADGSTRTLVSHTMVSVKRLTREEGLPEDVVHYLARKAVNSDGARNLLRKYGYELPKEVRRVPRGV